MRALLGAPTVGRGAFALVEGEAGIGKSALLQAMLVHARARGWEVRVATGDELDQRRPFSLIEAALGPVEVEAAWFDAGGAGITRPYVEAGTAETLISRVIALAAQRPLVLALEDVHWADPASLGVLGRLAQRLTDMPVIVLATARPIPRSTSLAQLLSEAVPGDRRLELGALPNEGVAALVAAAVGGTPGQRLLARAAEAAGNPLLVLELVAALMRADALIRTGGVVEAGAVVLPRGFAAALASRMLAVAADVRDVLRVAAILGRTFAATDLARVLACPTAQLLGGLHSAQTAGLIEEHEAGFAFRHELIRAALVDELAPTVRRALHLDVAHALTAVGASPGRVAEHLARGAEPGDRQATAQLAAHARTLAATVPDAAAGLLELTMELTGPADPQWPSLAADRAVALWWAGRWSDAERVAQASLSAGAGGPVAERALLTRAHALAVLGRLDETLAVARAGAGAALSGGARAHALALASFSQLFLGDRPQAIAEAQRARREAADAGDAVAGCFALHVLILGYGMAGQFARAVSLAEESTRLADSEPGGTGHRFAAHVVRGGFLIHLDRLAEADRVLTEGRLLAERLGDRQILPFFNTTRAFVCFAAGDWLAADKEHDVGLAAARAMGAGFLHGSLSLQALLAMHRGDLAAARQALTEADEASRQGAAAPFSEFAVLAAALLHEADGRPEVAFTALVGAWDIATVSGNAVALPALAVDYVRLALAQGEERRARDALEAVAVLAATHPDAPTLQGTVLRCRGLVDDDVDALLAAVDVQRAGPRPLERALACGEAAAALARAGAPDRAMGLLDEARATLSALGARYDLMRVVAAAREAGLRPGRRPGRLTEHGVGSLTPAERAVAELVAEGLTNPEIGEQLHVSRNTVRTHVSRALAKLGCRSRAEIAVAMVRHSGRPGSQPERAGR